MTWSLQDRLLFAHSACADPSAVDRALSAPSVAAIEKISRGSTAGSFVVVSAAVAAIASELAGTRTVVLELPRSRTVRFELPAPAGRTFKDLIVASRRALEASAGGSLASAGSDVLLACPLLHGRCAPDARHHLQIVVHAGARFALELTSPSRRIPSWFRAAIADRVDELVAHFGALHELTAAFDAASPTRALADARRFNQTARPRAANATVVDRFEAQVAARPDAAAVICGDTALTYRELDDASSRLAAHLRAAFDVAPGHRIATLVERSPRAIVSLLAIFKLGAVYVPLNPRATCDRTRGVVADAGAALVVGDSRLLAAASLDHVCRLAIDRDVPETDGPFERARLGDGAPAYLIYTSGSTGVPKGVLLAHGGLTNTVLDHIETFEVRPDDRYLQFMAMSFDGFLLDAFTALCAGASLVVAGDADLQDPERFMACAEVHRATLTTITPSYLQLLDPARLATLRVVVAAAEVLPPSLARKLVAGRRLYNGYGPTEATINSTLHHVAAEDCTGPIPIGTPSANKQLYVLGPELEPLPVGVAGELCITGAGLALGYVDDDALTRARFVDNPFGPGRLYRTGDLGAWTPDGTLLFRGRIDRQVKVNGIRIDLAEIQAVLDAVPGVRASHVVARSAPTEIVAFVQTGAGGTRDAVRAALAERLPDYLRPNRVVDIADWPLSPNGKIDEPALLARASELPPAPAAPATATERLVCQLWSEVLGVPVGADDDFIQLGGDSIRVIRAVHLARARGVELDARDLRSGRSPREIARRIGEPVADAAGGGIPFELVRPSSRERAALPPDVEDAYLASEMQVFMIEEYVRHAASDDADGIYLGCAEWRFEDDTLSLPALVTAVQHLHAANRCLRTVFVTSAEGRCLQLIQRARPIEVPCREVWSLTDERRDALFRAEIAAEARRPFDAFSGEPLIRFRIVRVALHACSLFISFHHAILDGWSGIELRNALLAAYRAAKLGGPLPEPRATDSHAELVALEQQVLRSREAGAFWRSSIASEEARAARRAFEARLATAASRRAAHGHAMVERAFSPELAASTIAAARRGGVTINAVVLSAVASAISQTLALGALVIGVVVNGRSDRLTEPLRSVGLFWNIVPVHVTETAARSPKLLQDGLNAMAPHAHFPLRAIERTVAGERLVMPLFNFVDFHNTGEGARRFREGVVQSRFHYPLTFFIKCRTYEAVPSIAVRLGFDRAYVSTDEATGMLSRLDGAITPQPLI